MRKVLCLSVCLAALGGSVQAQSLREIEARNAIRNPGLIAAGTRLEVTTA